MIEADFYEDHGFKVAYLVRLRSDQSSPREFVGVYIADSLNELRQLVKECCRPDTCEYLALPSGGIFRDRRSHPVPDPDAPEDQHADYLRDAAVTETWWDAFNEARPSGAWKALGPNYAANDQG